MKLFTGKMGKKLGTVAFAAAIAGTGLAASYVAEPAQQASAAYYADDYNGVNYNTSQVSSLPKVSYFQQAYATFSIGSYVQMEVPMNAGDTIVHTKAYLLKSDGTLQRYKTWDASYHYEGMLEAHIATSFATGKYVLVTTLKTSQGHLYQLQGNQIASFVKW